RPLLVTHRSADFDATGTLVVDPVKDQKGQIDVQSYNMDITIPDTKHLLVEADVHFVPLLDGLRTVRFDLVNTAPPEDMFLNPSSGQSSNTTSAQISESPEEGATDNPQQSQGSNPRASQVLNRKADSKTKPLHLLKVTDDKGEPLPFVH